MVTKVLLYLLLLGIALVLYYFTKAKTAGQPGNAPLRSWLQRRLTTERTSHQRANAVPQDVDFEQVSAILDEIYREFMSEAANIRRELNQRVDKLEAELRVEMSALVQPPTQEPQEKPKSNPDKPVSGASPMQDFVPSSRGNDSPPRPRPASQSWEPTGGAGFDVRYFQIFDEIQKGLSSIDIAAKLHIDVQEVERVRKIMSPT